MAINRVEIGLEHEGTRAVLPRIEKVELPDPLKRLQARATHEKEGVVSLKETFSAKRMPPIHPSPLVGKD